MPWDSCGKSRGQWPGDLVARPWPAEDIDGVGQPTVIAIAFAFAILVAVGFGLLPAMQGSKLDPAETWRYQ
ncbi:MAG: hypothetical protein H0W49_02925 [Nitrospirales bacterium]|nr:hypothetical protein [Nitrospirales bacterium]